MLNKALLVIRTLKYLKFSQLVYLFIRRLLPVRITHIDYQVDINPEFKLAAPITSNSGDAESLCFLGSCEKIDINTIDWHPRTKSKLWCFNLHYFDYLKDCSRSQKNKSELIESWLAHCPQQPSCAWHPFTNSLRVVNWIFFFSTQATQDIKKEWLQSLFEQVIYIEKNDERDLLANHYFENIKTMLFAGIFFQGDQAQKWRYKALQLLSRQLNEQFLSDGGHYERSPQYHAVMLENCLDIYNLLANNRDQTTHVIKQTVQNYCERALEWLADMHYENDEIVLFNDSANCVAPSYQQLYAYAVRLFRYQQQANIINVARLIQLDHSGYYGIEFRRDKFIIDCGEVEPSYQPGHMHCDFLSYELMLSGVKMIVNPGVFEYAQGAMRHYVRSTEAHNTISISGHQQSEIWSAFRVARRAKKLFAQLQQQDEWFKFSGAFRGFPTLQGGAQHERKVRALCCKDQLAELHVHDILSFQGEQYVANRIHLHPDVQVVDLGTGLLECRHEKKLLATLKIGSNCEYKIDSSYYCPQFGQKFENQCIVMLQSGNQQITMNYTIVKNN